MTTRELLTNRQAEVLNLIKSGIRDNGYPPTIREMGNALGIRSTNAVNDHMKALERKGYVERQPLASRGIKVLGDTSEPSRLERLEAAGIALDRSLCGLVFDSGNPAHESIRDRRFEFARILYEEPLMSTSNSATKKPRRRDNGPGSDSQKD